MVGASVGLVLDVLGSDVVDEGTVVSIGSSGSVITVSGGSVVVEDSSGVVDWTGGAVVSTGSSGSVMGGPAVVTDPEVEASVVDGDELASLPGIVVDGRIAEVVLGSTTQVGATPGELGICNCAAEDSVGSPSVRSEDSVRSTLLDSPSVASVFGRAVVGAAVAAGTAEVIGAGAESWIGSSSATTSTDWVVDVVDGGSVLATDVMPPTVGSLELTVPTRISFCTSSAWNASGPAIAATDSVDRTTARASRDGRTSVESKRRIRWVQMVGAGTSGGPGRRISDKVFLVPKSALVGGQG